ncbi:glycoside hydrolase family 71 protein [Botryobasidium botryosum FD-172 SS1]|uniref:Glycoside hydrolase family 71 protein n=1 Tax=Botryobasidium botryosum (strain FD-172 SS1) TaxID=930990 RepID=A0A067N5S3_BOTB1|nr:glycoside hydrolase family 71 protein [Botryobasidium botryosum FD-172 SS1]
MVGNTYPYTKDDWKRDINLAADRGIDGFALNAGRDDWQPARVADAYQAARETGRNFKLFMSFDMSSFPCGSAGDANILRSYINNYSGHPNQAFLRGKVLVTTFAGESCSFGQGGLNNAWNYAVKNGVNAAITFIPSFMIDPGQFGGLSVMDGDFNWNGGWPMGNWDINFDFDNGHLNNLGGRAFIASATPAFFTHYGPDTYNKNWIYRSDNWLFNNRWEQIIQQRNRIDAVEIVSWNDYGESHYIGPIAGAQPNSQAWVNGFDHQAWLDMVAYYITAFKTGSYPAVTKDRVFLWSRPHPKNANAPDHVARPNNWEWTDDNLYAVVFATGSGSLTLSIGSSSSTTNVGAGVTKIKLPLSPGSPRARLTTSRGTVDFAPSNFNVVSNPSVYNFNYFVAASPA